MLRRKAYDKLMEWKGTKKKKALCIIGARQIGKTTLIREFGRQNYENFVEINFVTDDGACEIFAGSLDADTIITNLTAYVRRSMEPGKTLVLFDEVQKCPDVRTAIKFLVEDGRFDYIESGSMLGVKHKEVKSYPVGFEEIYRMYPMDFEEYLWANGVQVSTIAYLKKCFDDKTPVSQSVHNTMKKLFYSYVVVGGMPEVVQTYVDTHDIGRVITNQRDILEQYRLDIAQYAEGNDKIKIRAIFDSIPTQLNEKNRRFYVNYLDKNARLTRYDNSFKWLDDAGVALPCYNVKEPKPPLALNEKHSLFKLFMNDTGLLCAACMDNIQFEILNGRLEINMGSILEDAIALQLKANGFILRYYDSKRHGEVDFVIQNGMRIDLAEVKSGGDYKKHKALDNVLGVEGWSFGGVYVLCADNIETENGITYLPWYLVMFLRPAQVPKGLTYEVDISDLRSL
ncbi:ATP-binding protein [Cloacibacillus evryensis]|uniref:ATP-binding protein n=1 Tax=Cloacibacillus evryensis TaxID=508460 RepID=UPI00045096CD|nr:AAA family ATPase [Cloacibacillus evryensis]EXG78472.1 putative ATPase (AAA+ superfamily) [Cloacibacillus evryensis DSM 19522]